MTYLYMGVGFMGNITTFHPYFSLKYKKLPIASLSITEYFYAEQFNRGLLKLKIKYMNNTTYMYSKPRCYG